jgi:hypothetical protein
VIHQEYHAAVRSVSKEAVVFRVVDVAGLPYAASAPPQVEITSASGTGSVRAVYAVGDVPGTYAADVRTGSSSMELAISVGDVTTSVVIPVY